MQSNVNEIYFKKEQKMYVTEKTTAMDRKVLLSTLWIFVVLNYLYCDILTLMDA